MFVWLVCNVWKDQWILLLLWFLLKQAHCVIITTKTVCAKLHLTLFEKSFMNFFHKHKDIQKIYKCVVMLSLWWIDSKPCSTSWKNLFNFFYNKTSARHSSLNIYTQILVKPFHLRISQDGCIVYRRSHRSLHSLSTYLHSTLVNTILT